MNKHKFTPGPWHIYELGYGYEIRPDICWVGDSSQTPREQQKANAALIAAAPEMYAFLEKLVNQIEENGLMQYDIIHNGENWVLEEAKELLRKARGESEAGK